MIKIIDAFTYYGLDVVLLAMLTAGTVQLFKATFLKKMPKKLMTFLPFAVGILFYAIYAGLVNMSIYYLLEEHVSVIEHGVSVGSAATLLYVLYEQFVREKDNLTPSASVVATLIAGYVPSERVEEAAQKIAEAIQRDVTGDGALRASEIIAENAEEGISEQDIKLLSKLIIETLAHVNT